MRRIVLDRLAKMTHPGLPLRIIPFRGEYFILKEEKKKFGQVSDLSGS